MFQRIRVDPLFISSQVRSTFGILFEVVLFRNAANMCKNWCGGSKNTRKLI